MAPLPLSDPTTNPTASSSKKRKRKDPSTSTPHILHQSTFRRPTYTHLHIFLSSTSPPANPNDLSPLTVLPLLTSALQSYLGATGAAIPIDILKIEGRDVWVRVQRGDERVLRAGLGEWMGGLGGEKVGWRVKGEEDGGEMFGG